jgi:hypothetical protein
MPIFSVASPLNVCDHVLPPSVLPLPIAQPGVNRGAQVIKILMSPPCAVTVFPRMPTPLRLLKTETKLHDSI